MTTESTLPHGLKTSVLDSDYKAEQDQNWAALDPNRIASGTFANRPAAGTANRFYYATDTQVLYWDNGATWDTTGLDKLPLAGGIMTGDIVMADGVGIDYSAFSSGSADPNVLDDYEEGEWTPIFGGSTSESGQVHATQNARYIKIGNEVTCTFEVKLSTLGTITGSVKVKGLPFTSISTKGRGGVSIGVFNALTTAVVSVGGIIVDNETSLDLSLRTAAATDGTSMVQGDLSATTQLIATVTYFTS
jgi:hypothetical protein